MNLINSGFDFNLNLKSRKYQPIVIDMISKNSYAICAQFIAHNIGDNKFIFNQINFKIYNISDGENYNVIKDVYYHSVPGSNEKAFYICMKNSSSPSFDAHRCSFEALTFNLVDKEKVQFHVNYNCDDDGSIGSDEWPCNIVSFG